MSRHAGSSDAAGDILEGKRELLSQRSTTGRLPSDEPHLLTALFYCKNSDADVSAFVSYVTRYMQLHNMALPISFAPDHPVEETGRLVFMETPLV